MALCLDLCPLLTDDVVNKLSLCGICSVRKLIGRTAEGIAKSSGLPLTQIKSIQMSLLDRFGPHPLSGRTLLEDAEDNMCIFPFGCSSVDTLLKGGIFSGEVTELWGPAASGKTQVCLSLTCHVITMTTWTVAYVDGGGGYSSTRLEHMLKARGLTDPLLSQVMEKVLVFKVFSVFDLMTLLSSIKYNISSEVDVYYSKLKLVIIDSMTLFIAPLLGGLQSPGSIVIMEVTMAMRTLSCDHFIAVVYCNNVVSAIGGGIKPALGQLLWSHVPSIRLQLSTLTTPQHTQNISKILTVSKSPRQVIGCHDTFSIGAAGIIGKKQ